MQRHVSEAYRPFTDVLSDIGRNVQDLLRSEIRLAQSELRQRLFGARTGSLVAVGLMASFLGAFFLLLAVLSALRFVMPAWAAALCLAAVLALTGAAALTVGLRRLRTIGPVLKPVDSMKENAEWAEHPRK
jgi:Putative Actinobacterial Holin-X, holin superfamily III